jgi:hypothetical protein
MKLDRGSESTLMQKGKRYCTFCCSSFTSLRVYLDPGADGDTPLMQCVCIDPTGFFYFLWPCHSGKLRRRKKKGLCDAVSSVLSHAFHSEHEYVLSKQCDIAHCVPPHDFGLNHRGGESHTLARVNVAHCTA